MWDTCLCITCITCLRDATKKTLLVYGHLDVQPAAKEDGWDTDPWLLTEKDGKLYGRGSTDDKVEASTHMNEQHVLCHNKLFPVRVLFWAGSTLCSATARSGWSCRSTSSSASRGWRRAAARGWTRCSCPDRTPSSCRRSTTAASQTSQYLLELLSRYL